MSKLLFLLFLSSLILSSCFSPMKVHDRTGAEEPGLPFYAKHGVHRQTTEYRTTWRVASLTLSAYEKLADGKRGPLVRQVGSTGNLNAKNADLIAETRKAIADPSEPAEGAFARFESEKEGKAEATRVLVENSIQTVAVVDYSAPRYLELRTPVFGSSTFKPELGPDGTLTKLEAAVTSTPEKIADLVPFKEVLSKVLGVAAAAAFMGTEEDVILELTLNIQEVGMREIWTYDWPIERSPLSSVDTDFTPLDLAGVRASYRRLPLTASPPAAAKNDNAYTFTGSVQVPKPKTP